MRIPATITKGDSTAWDDDPTTDNLGQPVDSSAYAVSYEIRGAVQATLSAVPQGSGWRTTLSTTVSDTLTAGLYFWQAVATKTGTRITLGSGQLTVVDNLSPINTTYDGRSQAQKDLDAVQVAMRAMIAGGGVQEYSIAGRSLRKMLMADLITLESKLKYQVSREKRAQNIANGLGSYNTVKVRF